jgi:hypothetical protein
MNIPATTATSSKVKCNVRIIPQHDMSKSRNIISYALWRFYSEIQAINQLVRKKTWPHIKRRGKQSSVAYEDGVAIDFIFLGNEWPPFVFPRFGMGPSHHVIRETPPVVTQTDSIYQKQTTSRIGKTFQVSCIPTNRGS